MNHCDKKKFKVFSTLSIITNIDKIFGHLDEKKKNNVKQAILIVKIIKTVTRIDPKEYKPNYNNN